MLCVRERGLVIVIFLENWNCMKCCCVVVLSVGWFVG